MNAPEKLIIICCLFQAVLCRDFSISLPGSVEDLSGLCVLIPCSFNINEVYDKDLQGDPTGIWLKDGTDNDRNRVFNSKVTKENTIEGKIIGNLLLKNCTTVFNNIKPSDSGDYYFRLEALGGLKYTYKTSVFMRVQDSPIIPSITLYKEDQGELKVQNEVLEGTSLSLICSARSPPCLLKPLSFSWNFLPEERRPEQNHNTSFSSSQLNFIASRLHHGLQFTCTATYQLQNQNKSAQSSHTLQVLYAPRNTSVSMSPSASVLLGSSVSLSCSSDANPAVLNYTWYRENGKQIGTGNHLTINTTDSTHSGLYYCSGQNQHGYQNTSVHLDVQYAPRNTSVSAFPSASVLLGSSVSLSCSSDANPAVLNYTWYRENGKQIGTGNHLTINTTDSTHSGLYYCRAQNQHGYQNTSVHLDVQYAPRNTSVSAFPSASVLLGSSVSLSCSSDANPAVLNYTWYRENGKQIGTGNHLTINTTDSTHSGLYYCRAQNQHGYQNTSVHLDVQYAPEVSSSSSCNSTQDLIMCSCEVDGNPAPTLEWRLSAQTTSSTRDESVTSTTLRSFISIPQSFTDMLSLQCVGSNKLGTDKQLFYLKKEPHHSAEASGVDVSSVLIGAAVGASGMIMLCAIFLCVRRVNPFQSGGKDSAGLTLNNRADGQEDKVSVYANGQVSSESLHYSTIMFSSGAGSEIKGSSSLTAEYATVLHDGKQHHEGRTTETEAKEREMKELQHSADVIYAQVKPQKR